jgi:D-alanyl-D-alanine carboxypeptidase
LVSENEADSAAASSSAAGSAAAEEAWALLLANEKNPLPEGYAPTLASMGSNSRNGEQFVDARIQKPLQAMLDAARADGIVLIVRSAYRSTAQQTLLFNSMVQDYMAQYEYDYAQAYAAAKRWRNVPGTSEHETGLAVDLVGEDYLYADLTSDLAQTDWAQWLAENAAQYGFILRYPQDKTAITGTSFEPWHYRYVGVQAAEEIARQGVCLEEYLDAVQSGAQK